MDLQSIKVYGSGGRFRLMGSLASSQERLRVVSTEEDTSEPQLGPLSGLPSGIGGIAVGNAGDDFS